MSVTKQNGCINCIEALWLYVSKAILKNNESAEDAVSEAFVRIIKNLDKINEDDRYKTRAFLVIIVRNVSIDILNKKQQYNIVGRLP